MRRKLFVVVLAGWFACPQVASADILDITRDNVSGALCSVNSPCGSVTVTFDSGTIHFAVDVFPNFIFHAFGINVAGSPPDRKHSPPSGVVISGIDPGAFTYASPSSANLSEFGRFDFVLDGPGQKIYQALSFDITRPANPFTGIADILETSDGGTGATLFAFHIADPTNTVTGWGATETMPSPPVQIHHTPEPGSIILLSTVLAGVLILLRKEKPAS